MCICIYIYIYIYRPPTGLRHRSRGDASTRAEMATDRFWMSIFEALIGGHSKRGRSESSKVKPPNPSPTPIVCENRLTL